MLKIKLKRIIPFGYCQCGCGQKTEILTRTYSAIGWKKGEPRKWIRGHHLKLRNGEKASNWKGGKHKDVYGYIRISNNYNHHKHDGFGRVKEHILIVEKVLGKPIPEGVIIHHINKNRKDNKNNNLIVCQDADYHKLIHTRLNAWEACGHSTWRKCWICKKYDSPKNLEISKSNIHHSNCRRKYMRKYMENYNKRKKI